MNNYRPSATEIQEIIEALTLKQALEYQEQTDKWCWVVDNLLDPQNISRKWSDAFEDQLDKLLEK